MTEPSPASAHAAGRVKDTDSAPAKTSLLGAIRVRLALIVLIAGIPLLMLSATITWQNYQLALGATAERAARLRESAASRHLSAVTSTRIMLQALALAPELTHDGAACHAILARMLAMQPERYASLVAFGANAAPLCQTGAGPETKYRTPWVEKLIAEVKTRADIVIGSVRSEAGSGIRVIPVLSPVERDGVVAGVLYAAIRLDFLSTPPGDSPSGSPGLWVVDRAGTVSRVMGGRDVGLPAPAVMRRLEANSTELDAIAESGAACAYASQILSDDYALIVAYPASADRKAARSLLWHRVLQLGVLLLLGLAGVAYGVHVALCQPLTRLSEAVGNWRKGGPFDASALGDPPTEVAGLAASFRDAISAVAEHEQRLSTAMEQQELLMKEIHHRVKNNLQIVASLLNLQASRIRVPEARAEFASARDRVRALATLHRHLYAQGEVHTIDMPVFLAELCGQLFQAMGEIEGKRISLAIDSSALRMTSDQAVPLSLIVTEAVSNALKYAFPGGRRGRVAVRLHPDGDMAELVVEDDGVGIPPGRFETEMGTRDGIGITLIRGFARQLGGELKVEEDGGTRYTLRVKLQREIEEPEMAA